MRFFSEFLPVGMPVNDLVSCISSSPQPYIVVFKEDVPEAEIDKQVKLIEENGMDWTFSVLPQTISSY